MPKLVLDFSLLWQWLFREAADGILFGAGSVTVSALRYNGS